MKFQMDGVEKSLSQLKNERARAIKILSNKCFQEDEISKGWQND